METTYGKFEPRPLMSEAQLNAYISESYGPHGPYGGNPSWIHGKENTLWLMSDIVLSGGQIRTFMSAPGRIVAEYSQSSNSTPYARGISSDIGGAIAELWANWNWKHEYEAPKERIGTHRITKRILSGDQIDPAFYKWRCHEDSDS